MPQRIRRHVTFANVTAMVALVFAMGGTGYALSIPNNSVGTKQIKKNGVSNSDIRANAVTSSKVKDRSLKAVDFAVGQLPAGAQGPPGVVANVIVRRVDIVLPAGAGDDVQGAITSGFATCAAGEKIIGGSVNISNATEPPQMEILVSRGRPSTTSATASSPPTVAPSRSGRARRTRRRTSSARCASSRSALPRSTQLQKHREPAGDVPGGLSSFWVG